jgi:3-phenylpropionate/trans-cinnamate dioxygenase ferredoxin reductase subunit
LTIPGCELDGMHFLRTIEDADRLRGALQHAQNVVVIGGGWIGSEVAASARHLGCAVTMIHHHASPLESVLGPEVAGVYRALHAEHGVVLESDSTVTTIRGAMMVEEVVTSRGTRIAADVVVAGIGARPRSDLAVASGLATSNGVSVDEHLRTSDDRVYAAGDVADAYHPHYGGRLRVEHWANARKQGLVAGRNLAGRHEVYDALPYFFSDQYDVGMEYVGYAPAWDRVVVRGELADREFIAFWIADDAVVAAMNVNVWDVGDPLLHLIRTRAPIDDDRLRDTGISLSDVGTRRRAAPRP